MGFSAIARNAGALPIDEVLPQLGGRARDLAPRRAGRAARRGQDHPAFPWNCSMRAGAATARSSCWSRAASPRAPPPSAWPASSAKNLGKPSACARAWTPRVGPKTRVEVVTEGVFARMILDDPSLEGVSAVLFDEFHERSLDADLGLALALDAQDALRPDLRILVMSATLDGARVVAA